jgi:hypothetical protein
MLDPAQEIPVRDEPESPAGTAEEEVIGIYYGDEY